MSAYYNEHDPRTAAWLRELIKEGLIADGEVDERSIVDVSADDVRGFVQCHWFAGIGGWAYALELAGWPNDRHVWTGSCPCQPFSSAGAQAGGDDPRHLWPAWFRLIRECRPDAIFGEQVESAIGHGWLDLVLDDLERKGYAVGAIGLPAASVGAPHIRQRLWFVAESSGAERGSWWTGRGGEISGRPYGQLAGSSDAGDMGDTTASRRDERRPKRHEPGEEVERGSTAPNPWADCDWLPCRDGKSRPVRSGSFPLASGVPARVVRLRGFGNAIVPQVAAEFIGAYLHD